MFPARSLLAFIVAIACLPAQAATLVVDSTDPAASLPNACTHEGRDANRGLLRWRPPLRGLDSAL